MRYRFSVRFLPVLLPSISSRLLAAAVNSVEIAVGVGGKDSIGALVTKRRSDTSLLSALKRYEFYIRKRTLVVLLYTYVSPTYGLKRGKAK